MSENDAQLELKKRARRRLVGAIALAVLAAIVLPMVMDQEPKPTAQDIQIRIPSQEAGSFTSRILPVKPGATPTPLPPAAAPEARPSEPPAAKTQAEAPAAAPAKPVAAVAPPPVAPAKPAPAKPPKAVEKSAEKPAAKANGKAEPAQSGSDQWIVQIGAYRDAGNVRNLQAKVKEQGYNSYTEPLVSEGVKKTRVRAGPFPSKEAAEKAQERLKRIGVDGIVAQKQ
jgi:DedD protein